MTSQLDENIRHYCHEIESLLVCKVKTKKKFMAEFQSDVQSFISESDGDVSIEDVLEIFGTPEIIANGFLDILNSKEIKKALGWKKILLTGVCVALLLIGLYLLIAWLDGHLMTTGYMVDGVIESTKLNK